MNRGHGHHEPLRSLYLGGLCLGGFRQHARRHSGRIIDRLPELPVRIDDDAPATSERPPTSGEVTLKFKILEAWLDDFLHQVLAVAKQIDERAVAVILVKDVEDHGFPVCAKPRVRERVLGDYNLSSILDGSPDLLRAQPLLNESVGDAQLHEIEKTEVELFDL